ncbi:MAG: transketolase [Gammaproteobacteria bacterium]|nr:transketolase [Gammaproteobacteria bacterium]
MSNLTTTRRERANAIRALSMDAVQQANSGHPGAPMGMADIAEVLWRDHLKHNPKNPHWADRDRFVLSNGHGSMLMYSLLHLTGYDVSIDDLKNFRQLDSKTPGHPEFGYTPGVETTTGPLGQGITNAVGFALAEKMLAAQFNRDGHDVIDHRTWTFLGDGCLMEGVSHEACSLAGTLGLNKLVAFWDDNGISIDGEVEGWFTDNTPERFRAYGWNVIADVDGHDADAINAAIEAAKQEQDRPTLICCKTVIGFGSPNKQGKEECHGAPLGADEIALAREQLGWTAGAFEVPEAIQAEWDCSAEGASAEAEWEAKLAAYQEANGELADELLRRLAGDLPDNFAEVAANYIAELQEAGNKVASRKASQMALNAFGAVLPELAGGSADLAGSNLTIHGESKSVTGADASGNYIHYGVREFAMGAIMNGLALHGGFIPYGGTFLVFSDYMRNAMRMSALMKQRVVYVLTHDSIGLGEDGPTHQPVEHVASLRLIPNLDVWRPADAVETAAAWQVALENIETPSALALSRQGIAHQPRTEAQVANIERGGYVLVDTDGTPDAIVIGTGSELELAVAAAEQLKAKGKQVRVVSMPSTSVFDRQDADYQDSVLPAEVAARVAVEAGVSENWYRYVGYAGEVIGIDQFGESAPGGALMEHFGFTTENVVAALERALGLD